VAVKLYNDSAEMHHEVEVLALDVKRFIFPGLLAAHCGTQDSLPSAIMLEYLGQDTLQRLGR
jgi:hypothetical protein